MSDGNGVSALRRGLLVVLLVVLGVSDLKAQETPATMIISGTISKSASTPAVIAEKDDQILVVNQTSGNQEGLGSVLDPSGIYAVDMSKTSAFNGTVVTLRIRKGGTTYSLLGSDGKDVSFPFSGGLFPTRLSLSPKIGTALAATPTPTTPTTPTPTTGNTECSVPAMDVTGDGVCDQRDIEAIREYVAGRTKVVGKRDVNNDGVVNTRDMIEAIRAIRLNKPIQQRP